MTTKAECKYFEGLEAVRLSLMTIGAIRQGVSFETNIIFKKDTTVSGDTGSFEENSDEQIESIGKLLQGDEVYSRWRTAETQDGILQLFAIKKCEPTPSEFKNRSEIEFFVPMRYDKFKNILSSFGYVKKFKYEKIREDWKIGNVQVSLDTLPFIRAIKLKGERVDIVEMEKQLNLSPNELSNDSYYELYRKHCILTYKEIGESVVFQEPNRTKLRRWVIQDW